MQNDEFVLPFNRQLTHSKSPIRKDRDGHSAISCSDATRRCAAPTGHDTRTILVEIDRHGTKK